MDWREVEMRALARAAFVPGGMDGHVSKPQEHVDALERQLGRDSGRLRAAAPPLDDEGDEKAGRPAATPCEKLAYDGSVLAERFEGDEETIAFVLKTFLKDAPEQIELLKSALDAKDAMAIRRHAHSLKGAAGNVGADALRELSLQAENAGEIWGFDTAAQVAHNMEQAFERLKNTLNERIPDLASL